MYEIGLNIDKQTINCIVHKKPLYYYFNNFQEFQKVFYTSKNSMDGV